MRMLRSIAIFGLLGTIVYDSVGVHGADDVDTMPRVLVLSKCRWITNT